MAIKPALDRHFSQVADALQKHASQGRIYAVPMTTKQAADAGEKIIRALARASVKDRACVSFRKQVRYVPLNAACAHAPVYGYAVFSDKNAAHKFAFGDLARHQLKVFEVHGSGKHAAQESLKSVAAFPAYHTPNGFHAG